MRPTSNTSSAHRRAKPVLTLVLTLLLAAFAVGCGGGGGGEGGGQGGETTGKTGKEERTGTEKERGTKPGPKPKPGSVIRDFAVNVTSPTQATITANLSKASELTLRVRKIAGAEKTRVGRVALGRKPAGRLSAPWNLKVAGKQLAPGQYEVAIRGRGAGQSLPETITVPGG